MVQKSNTVVELTEVLDRLEVEAEKLYDLGLKNQADDYQTGLIYGRADGIGLVIERVRIVLARHQIEGDLHDCGRPA